MIRRRSPGLGRSLLLRGLRTRARLHAALFAAATLMIAAAVVGGVFAGAAEESVVRDRIAAAPSVVPDVPLPALPPAAGGVRLEGVLGGGLSDDYPVSQVSALLRHRPADGRWSAFPHGTAMLQSLGKITLSSLYGPEGTQFVWRDGFCAHIRVVAGRCATGPQDAMISEKTAAAVQAVDTGLTLLGKPLSAEPLSTGLRIVGIYRPDRLDDPFWFGGTYFEGTTTASAKEQAVFGNNAPKDRTGLDAVLVPEQAFLSSPGLKGLHVTVDYRVDPDAVTATSGALLAQVADMRRALAGTDWQVRTVLASVIRSVQPQRAYVVLGSRFVALQLVALGLVVLFGITLDVVEGRRREIALAKLRGQSWRAVTAFALGEPLTVLVAAVPVGVLLGVLGGGVLDLLLMRPGTPVGLPLAAVGGAAITLLGGAAAVVVASLRVSNRPILDQWNRVQRRRDTPWWLRIAVVVACGLLGWGAWSFAQRGGTASSAIVLEPILLITVVAVLGVPLVARLARALGERSRATERYARFLSLRRLAREPAVPRTAMLLIVTLGLAAFAVGGDSVLLVNREARSAAELGAPVVVPVQYDGVTDPVAAVQRADPDGRWATAAALWSPDGGDTITSTVLAVEPRQLAAFGLPVRGGMAPPALARRIDASVAPAVRVVGDRVTATLDAADLTGPAAPFVRIVLRDAGGHLLQPIAGAMREGTHDYGASVACTAGCSFLGFLWDRPPAVFARIAGTVHVRGLTATSGDRTVRLDPRVHDRAAWRAAVPVSQAADRVSFDSTGVLDAFSSSSGYGGLQYSSTVQVVPLVSTPIGMVVIRPPTGFAMDDQLGNSQPVRRVATTPLLPSVLDVGVAADLAAVDQGVPDLVNEADWQVWMSASAPADALQRLDRAGLIVGTPVTLADRETTYARQAPGLSFGLLRALAVVAAVLAVLSTAVTAASSARARAREAASMRMIGVPARAIVRAAVLEQVLLLGGAAVLALPAGVAAVLLVMPQLREFATGTPVPLVFTPTAWSLVAVVAVFAVAVAATGASAAIAVVRAAGPQRLREVDL